MSVYTNGPPSVGLKILFVTGFSPRGQGREPGRLKNFKYVQPRAL